MPAPDLRAALKAREDAHLLRRRRCLEGPQVVAAHIDGRPLLSFASNDYLGLANDARLKQAAIEAVTHFGVGAGASHLLGGHHRLHDQAEAALAAFAGFERALLFSTGYMANLGIITALADRHAEVFADKLNHASLNDAVLLAGARFSRFPHQDLVALERRLAASTAAVRIILVDAVFSMDGDLAPVPALLALARAYDAWLVLDDAHGFGVLGNAGRGILEHFGVAAEERLIYMATLGKAAGVSGAFVAGAAPVIDWLLQAARTAIYTTAMPPALSAAVLATLEVIRSEPQRRVHLARLIERLRAATAHLPCRWLPSITPIQPLLVGESEAALALSARLEAGGIWAPAIRPPTVPKGGARLRVSLSAAHTEEEIDRLAAALDAACHELSD